MSEIVANKKIVISAEDRVTSVIAKTNQAFNQLEQHLSQLGMKFNSGASEQSSYKNALNSTKSTVNETDEAIRKLDHNIDKLSGTRTVSVHADTVTAQTRIDKFSKNVDALKNKAPIIKPRADTSEAQSHLHQLTGATNEAKKAGHSLTKSFVVGSLISNGIQSATISLIGFAKQGFAAAAAGQQVAARWSSLGMTKGQIKEVGAAVTDLKENTSMSGAAVSDLVTRFYGLTGSAEEAINLSKGVGSITDSLRLSGSQADAFAGGLTRIESAGKVTTQSLGRLEKQVPGLTATLQKASGMSKKSFDDLLASGKMTSDQFNDILIKASQSYRENAKAWDNTTQGALNNIKQTWANSWKTMMTPLTQSSGQGLGALSKALQALQPEFKQLGETIAELATKFAKWLTPQHAKDLGEIVGAFGKMAFVLGKGVWHTVMAPFELIGRVIQLLSGKHGDALDAIATALDHISKNKIALTILEGIGTVLGAQLAYGKLFKVADGLGLVKDGILGIGKIKFTGNIFKDIFKGAESLKKIKIDPARWFKGGKFSFKNLFKNAPKDAATAGDKAGGNFVTRLFSKVKGAKVEGLGRGLGSKLGGAFALAFGAIDLFKALSSKKDKAAKVGKSLGETAGGMGGAAIGASLGSVVPGIGTLIGGLLGGLIGSKAGGMIGEAIGKCWGTIKKGATEVGKFLLNALTLPFKAAFKVGEWFGNKLKGILHRKSNQSSRQPSQGEIKSLGGNRYSKSDIANIKQMNSAVRAYTRSLKELKAVVKKDDPTKQLRNMSKEFRRINPSLKESAKYWRGLTKPLEASAKAFRVVDKALDIFKRKNNPMDRLNSSVQKLTKTVKKEQFGKLLAKQMQIADKSMSGKHSFVGQFESMTKRVISQLRQFRKSFNADWRNTWSHLDSYPSRGLSRTASIVSSRLDAVLNREHSFSHSFLSSWRSWVSDVVSAMRSGFEKLPGIAQHAMSGIVSRLNSGISAINAVISDFGGDKRLGSIHYARGTFFHPGGKAVLNDGPTAHKQELVWEPSRGFSLPQGQNTVHDLERGAMVLDAPHTDPLLNRMGIPHYAGGTLSEDEQDNLAEEFIDNPVKASRDLVLKVTNWNSNVPAIADLGKATAIGFSRGIANVLKDLLGIIKEPINGDWTPVIKSAFRVLHISPAGWMISKFLRQIQTESGGRENAIGGTDGLPDGRATGLLQFKPGTFAHWARAPYDHIMKGFDQIVTAIRVLMAGGEGGWSNFGMGHGWATGGEITSQQFGWVGDNAQHHEFVINPYNSNSLPLLTKAWAVMNANHPEWRTPTGSSYNAEMIALMKAAVASINNIDIHPRVYVEDVRRPINNRDAMDYSRVMN
jgi:tape measure domain-containing protein